MKKKLLILLVVSILSIGIIGCGEPPKDNVSRVSNSVNKNRFIDTGDTYAIGDINCNVYYDSITNIVYIGNGYKDGYRGYLSLSVLYNKDRQPMTIDEYNETK